MTRIVIRWILLPFEVALGFLLAAIAAVYIVDQLHLWWEPVVGFLAAFAVVSISYARAPRRPLRVAFVSYVLGGVAAYRLLRDSSFPEDFPRPYDSTFIPFCVTLAGGALALAAAGAHTALRRRSTTNKSLERALPRHVRSAPGES